MITTNNSNNGFNNRNSNLSMSQPAPVQNTFSNGYRPLPTNVAAPQLPSMDLASGRMVVDENEIIPKEIPNDGNVAVFVQRDLQKIYLKTWSNTGKIETNVYSLVVPDQNPPQPQANPQMDSMLALLTGINEGICKMLTDGIPQRKQNFNNPKQNPQNNQQPKSDQNGNGGAQS